MVEERDCTAAAIGSWSAAGSVNSFPSGVVEGGAKIDAGEACCDASACAAE